MTTEGGPVTVSGMAGAQVDSGGGPVTAAGIDGPLTAITEGGRCGWRPAARWRDTGGGPVTARASRHPS